MASKWSEAIAYAMVELGYWVADSQLALEASPDVLSAELEAGLLNVEFRATWPELAEVLSVVVGTTGKLAIVLDPHWVRKLK